MKQCSVLVADMNNEEFAMCTMEKRSFINLSSSSEMILVQALWYRLKCFPESTQVFNLLTRRQIWLLIIMLIIWCGHFWKKIFPGCFLEEKRIWYSTKIVLHLMPPYIPCISRSKGVSTSSPVKNGCPSHQVPLHWITASGESLEGTYISTKFKLAVASTPLSKRVEGPASVDHQPNPGHLASTLQAY